jgi:subtilase family serine protease
VAWSGAGSGCSHYIQVPSWQKGPEYAIGCANRVGNDIAADADPNTGVWIYDSLGYNGQTGGWFAMGGTSLAAPIVAATYALAHDLPSSETGPQFLSEHQNGSTVRDITHGSTGGCLTYICNAKVGFDGPSGWGTPIGAGGF